MTPAVVTGAVTINALSHAQGRKRKAERRQTQEPLHLPVQRAPCKGALAYRRSTTVLTKGTFHPKASPRARLRAADIATPPHFQRCTSRSSRNAGGHDARDARER